jgi:hypothetical protein
MCNFDIDFTTTARELFVKLKSSTESANGTIDGDMPAGSFSIPVFGGHISGNYTIAGQILKITITKKPIIVSCNKIREFLQEKL